MNRFIRGAVALAAVGVGAPAFAADLPVQAPVYKALPPPPLWTGFYIGGTIGGAWAKDNITDVDGLNNPAGFSYSLQDAGIIGGGVIGYNLQYGHFVYGVEVDLGGIGFGKTVDEPVSPGITNHLGGGFYGDATGRLGYEAAGALFYAKGGWAYFDGKASVANPGGGAGGGTATTGPFEGGWTVGAGIEYAFAPAWSAKVEYQHFDFGSQTATLSILGSAIPSVRYSNDLTVETFKLGVNYHFH
jgi:outer membrane immunogenic protein